ncbi:MAG: polymer-forming cytoskeletal protein [Caldilineales bacterium]|nr:polymer-forming cytoskeletal protein [Caldilineales bacterium]MDW8318919.1 polymer-forming cytoskeletal protein [Anaerolineae bacterium]
MAKRLAWTMLVALALTALVAFPVLAQGPQPGKLILGGSYTLERGEAITGGLAVVGGDVRLEPGSRVDGDVIVTGGSVDVAGAVNGDIALLGGRVMLASTARVDGDVVVFGGTVDRAPGAVVTGTVREGVGLSPSEMSPFAPLVPFSESRGPGASEQPWDWLLRQFLRLVQAVALSLAFGALALVVTAIWPQGMERIGRTEMEQPFLAFAVGLLTWVLALGLMVVMVITLCLIPFALVLGLALMAVVVVSWIATGWVVGHKLAEVFRLRSSNPALEAAVGTVLLLLVYFLVSLVWCMDFVFGLLVLFLGTGALVLTRFGSQPYPPTRPAAPAGPIAPQPTESRAVMPSAPAQPPSVRSGQELGLPPDAAGRVLDDTPPAPGMRSGRDLGLPPDADRRLLDQG